MPSTEDFHAAGLYDPTVDAGTGRLELLQWLDAKGFTIDEMVIAHRSGGLGAMAGDRRLATGKRLSRSEAIARSGFDEQQFDAFATAFGFATTDEDATLTAVEVDVLQVFGALATMFSPAEALSFVRVVASSIARISEAAVSLFLTEIESPMLASGESELDLAIQGDQAVGLLDGFTPQLDPLLRHHVLQAIYRTRAATIDGLERLRYRYAVGFVDLVGFTEKSDAMAPRQLASFLREFEGRAHDVVTEAGARVVKLIGDEVMFVAAEPGAACIAATRLMAGFGAEHDHVLPRGGLAYGEVLVRGGDYYGSVVNLASRLVEEAVPQELLVTEELANATTSCDFEPAGRRMVKGFAAPIPVRSLMSL